MSELSPQSDQRKLHLPERQSLTVDLEQIAAKIGADILHIAVEIYTLDDFTSHEKDIKEYFKRKYGEDEWTSHVVEIDNVEYVFFVSTEEGKNHLVEKIADHVIGQARVRLGLESPYPAEIVGDTSPTAAISPSPVSSPEPVQRPDPRILKTYGTTPEKQPEVDIKA